MSYAIATHLTGDRRGRPYGFTLVELLVTVGLIAVIVGILIPVLGSARKTSSRVECGTRLREIHRLTAIYLDRGNNLPPLNNNAGDSPYQYNYLIYDGANFANCWGPLLSPYRSDPEDPKLFYCPVQTNEAFQFATPTNDWPIESGDGTAAGYARRFGLTGKTFTSISGTIAFASDLMHRPGLVESGHEDRVNVVFTDGHIATVDDEILLNNTLGTPFDSLDDPIVEEIWKTFDRNP